MVCQQIVKLKSLLIIAEINITPLIVRWKRSALGFDFLHALCLNGLIELASVVSLEVLWHRLCVPEVMLIK